MAKLRALRQQFLGKIKKFGKNCKISKKMLAKIAPALIIRVML